MAALSPFSTRTGDKTTHGSSQSTGRTALVAIEVFVVMGMNRIDKGMNRARTVGGALHGTMEWLAGMAWRHQIERADCLLFHFRDGPLALPRFHTTDPFCIPPIRPPGARVAQADPEEGMGRISITDLT